MSAWKTVKLVEVVTVIGGAPFKSSDFGESGIPVLKIKNIKPNRLLLNEVEYVPEDVAAEYPESFLQKGDLLITMTGNRLGGGMDSWVGKVALFNEERPYCLNQRVGIIRPKAADSVDIRFLSFALSTSAAQREFVQIATGSGGQANLSPKQILSVQVPSPPLSEQQTIVQILGTLDDKIELNRRMNQTLESIARAVFKSWFIDFDISGVNLDLVISSVAAPPAASQGDLQASSLGQIPKGWRVGRIGSEVKLTKGVSYRSEELTDSETALVTLKSINRGGGYRSEGLKPYTGKFRNEQVIQPEDLVIAHTDVTQAAEVIGKPALVLPDYRFKVLVPSLDLSIVRPAGDDLSQYFFYLLFSTQDFQDHVYGHISGTTVLHLSKESVASYQFARPPEAVGKAFTSIVQPLFQRIAQNETESRTLASLRDALLPKLLSGELQIPTSH